MQLEQGSTCTHNIMSGTPRATSDDEFILPTDPEDQAGTKVVSANSTGHPTLVSLRPRLGAYRALLVEDDFRDTGFIRGALLHSLLMRFEVVHVEWLSQALDRLAREEFDVVLLDLYLPDSSGIATITQVRQHAPRVAIVALTRVESETLATEALDAGAQDIFVKDHSAEKLLVRTILYAVEQNGAEENLRFLVEAGTGLSESLSHDDIVKRIFGLATQSLADWCVITTLDDAARLQETFSSGRQVLKDGDGQDEAMTFTRGVARNPDDNSTLSDQLVHLAASRQPLLLPEVSPEQVEWIAGELNVDAEWREWLSARRATGRLPAPETTIAGERPPRYTSLLISPLIARGHVLGLLTVLGMNLRRPYGQNEMRLAEGLAERAALALDNARLYAEAQQAVQARENLLSEVSHDLRTPLTSIRAGLGLLNMSLEDEQLKPEQTELLEKVRRNTERLTAMVGDLLAYNAMKSGNLPLTFDLLEMSEVVRAAAAVVEPMFHRKNQHLALQLAEELCVKGDGRYLEQALVNLLDNAHKHTPQGTKVTVQTTMMGNEVVLVIRDNGPGIEISDQEKIFQQFYRTASSRRTAGLGLGLALVRSIIEGSGGRIWVDSSPGKGAAFIIVMPRAYQDDSESSS